MMPIKLTSSWTQILFAVAAIVLYVTYLPIFPIGYVNDDAKYIALALSLLQGHYSDLAFVNQPPHSLYPPAYPLFLVPFVACVQPHWIILAFVSIGLTLLACWFLWKIVGGAASGLLGVLTVTLFAFNPQTAGLASRVMSEPFFMCSLLCAFWSFRLYLNKPSKQNVWILRAAVCSVMLTRSVGPIVFIAMILPLLFRKKWRTIFSAFSLPLLGWTLWQVRNLAVTSSASYYTNFWKSGFAFFWEHPLALVDNIQRVTYTALIYMFQAIQLPYSPLGMLIAALGAVVIFMLWGRGMKQLYRLPGVPLAWVESIVIFFISYYVIHTGWAVIDERYVWPLLPFLIWGVLLGMPSLRYSKLFAVFVLGAFVYRHAVLLGPTGLKAGIEKNPLPLQTFGWMKAALPAQARIMYSASDSLWLYTGFQGIAGLTSVNRAEFEAGLKRRGITHVLSRPLANGSVAGTPGMYDQSNIFKSNLDWITTSTGTFRIIYLNRKESAAVYEIH